MGCRMVIGIKDGTEDAAVLYDSVTGLAFGPVFDSEEDAEMFCDWLQEDPRKFTSGELAEKYHQWFAGEDES